MEVLWNQEAHSEKKIPKEDHADRQHPRAEYKVSGKYGFWTGLPVTYGNYGDGNAKRCAMHTLCSNTSDFGKTSKSFFLVLPMAKLEEEEWIFIDRVAHIRGIYLPISHATSPAYEDLCTYVQIKFSHADYPKMEHLAMNKDGEVERSMKEVYCDQKCGLSVDGSTALGLNVKALISALLIPWDMRKKTIFEAGEAIIVQSSMVGKVDVTQTNTKPAAIDFVKVASKNNGLEMEWKADPPSDSTFLDLLAFNLSFYIGFVPAVGPLLSFSTSLICDLITDPENAFKKVQKHYPAVFVGNKLVEMIKPEMASIAQHATGNLPEKASVEDVYAKVESKENIVGNDPDDFGYDEDLSLIRGIELSNDYMDPMHLYGRMDHYGNIDYNSGGENNFNWAKGYLKKLNPEAFETANSPILLGT